MRHRTTAIALVAAFAGGALTNQLLTGARSAHADSQKESPYAQFDQMGRVLAVIEHGYVDTPGQEKLLDGAIKGMVAELDPHSSYMTPDEYADFQSDTEGKFGGIGVEVDDRDGDVIVVAPIEGSPAFRAGIKSGDRIVTVDDKLVRGTRVDKLIESMRGEPGTKVRVGVVREGVEDILYFDLVREIVHVSSVEAKMLAHAVLYVRVKQFQENTHAELVDAVGKARGAANVDPKAVILDLRYNPGGLVDQAEGVADELMDSGTIYSTRHRGKIVEEVTASHGGVLADLPCIALVNEYSASASELVSGALQDSKRALIVGARTFGKGSVQTIFDLPGGSGLRLTTMRYYTPSGRSIQAQGIMPDVVVRRADGKPADVVRESDLEGHLAAEEGGAKHDVETVDAPPDQLVPTKLSEMKDDPTEGKDFVLAEGYRRVTKLIQ
ncbi:MAG: S41 family peptidase [Polyangiaceae bacterium]